MINEIQNAILMLCRATIASIVLCNTVSAQEQKAQPSKFDQDLELQFNGHCRECHSFVKGDNRLGPSLFGVIGRKAGSVPGFPYSTSVKDSGVTWNEATLDKWIRNPRAVISGNNMSPPFPGVDDPAIRAKIIAFLKEDSPQKTQSAK